MALFGSVTTLRSQLAVSARFESNFDYLAEVLPSDRVAYARLPNLGSGKSVKIELENGAFAIERVHAPKMSSDMKWELHRAYNDVLAIVGGGRGSWR